MIHHLHPQTMSKPRLLSRNISETLKGLILSLCEANVEFTSKLCILGSIHIVADGEEVSSFLLKETKEKIPETNDVEQVTPFSNTTTSTPKNKASSPTWKSSSQETQNNTGKQHSRADITNSNQERFNLSNSRTPTMVIKREFDNSSVGDYPASKKRWRSENNTASRRSTDGEMSPSSNRDHSFPVESKPVFPGQPMVGYPCTECSAVLSSGLELRAHISILHADAPAAAAAAATDKMTEQSQEPFLCPLCHMHFTSKEWLQEHAKVCMLQCSECGKTFCSQQEYADHHLNVHNKLMLVCKQCNSIFKSRDGLNCHMNTAHNRSKIYPCGVCPEGFYTRQAAYVHRRKMHPSHQTPSQGVVKGLNVNS